MSPSVSIVIPCFNAEACVADAIRSALSQTYENREIIVVDDGSTDGSAEIIESFGSAVRAERGPRRGGAAARNRGVALSSGELIQFLDADDLLHPAKLERQVNAVENSTADVVFCWGTVSPEGVSGKAYRRVYTDGDPVEYILDGILQTSAPLHRREVLERAGGFSEDLPCAQEFDLHLRLACQGATFSQLPEVLFTVRRRHGSVSSDEVRLYRVMASVLHRAACEEAWCREPRRRKAIARRIAQCARWLLRLGDTHGGVEALRTAEAVHVGGVRDAYSVTAQAVRNLVGPVQAERLLWRLRRTVKRWRSPTTAAGETS